MDRTVQIIWSWTRDVGVPIKSLTFDYTVSWQIWAFRLLKSFWNWDT